MSRNSLRPVFAVLPILTFCVLLPIRLAAQSTAYLDRLIFEPVLLQGSSPAPAVAASGNGNSILHFFPGAAANDPIMPPGPDLGKSLAGTSALEQLASLDEDTGRYIGNISDIENTEGAYSSDLLEDLMSLGDLYRREQKYEQAIEMFKRAEHISRVNFGLYDPAQFPSIEKTIDSYVAMGDVANAMREQRYLIYLHEKYYGQANMNTLPSLIGLANQNMNLFSSVIGNREPVISFSFSMGNGPNGSSSVKDPRRMAFGNLFLAQRTYAKAIVTMIKNEEFFRPEILDLEYKYLETLFLQANLWAMLDEPDYYLSEQRSSVTGSHLVSGFAVRNATNYYTGNDAFERILIYLKNNPQAPPAAAASALADYGDWQLLFNHRTTAMRYYQQAFDLMQTEGVDRSVIDSILNPPVPLQLPLITSKPNSREKFGVPEDQELNRDGYIDVAFTINRYGNARHINILDKSANATGQIERRLKRYLRNAPFRPRFREDRPAHSDRISLRYYFTYYPETGTGKEAF